MVRNPGKNVRNKWTLGLMAMVFAIFGLAACSDDDTTTEGDDDATTTASTEAAEGESDDEAADDEAEGESAGSESVPLFDGFESADDECRIAGESDVTNEFLGDSATLVACPVGSDRIAELESANAAEIVIEEIDGLVVLSVPGA